MSPFLPPFSSPEYGLRTATNVEFFVDPLFPNPQNPIPAVNGNWYDGDLTASGVQHDSAPYYVRGNSGPGFDGTFNWRREIADV